MTTIQIRLRTENSCPGLYGPPKIQTDAADTIDDLLKVIDMARCGLEPGANSTALTMARGAVSLALEKHIAPASEEVGGRFTADSAENIGD